MNICIGGPSWSTGWGYNFGITTISWKEVEECSHAFQTLRPATLPRNSRPETHGRGLEVLGWGVVVLRWEGGDARLTEDQQPDEEGS